MKRLLAIALALLGLAAPVFADQSSIVVPQTTTDFDTRWGTPNQRTFENAATGFINPALRSIASNFYGTNCTGIASPVPYQWCIDTTARAGLIYSANTVGTNAWNAAFVLNTDGTPLYGTVANSLTAAYTLTTTDCGKAVVLSGGFYTITLPATTGFVDGCMIRVNNNDTRGKALSGFPADQGTRLFPQQSVTVVARAGAWVTVAKPGRWVIQANTIFNVNPSTGNDANDGLATGSGAFATLQAAWNVIAASVDSNGFTVTLHAEDGTYTTGLRVGSQPTVGNGLYSFTGNVTTPTNVVLSPTGICLQVIGQVWFQAGGFYCDGPSVSIGIYADGGSSVQTTSPITFGRASSAHLQASHSSIFVGANYTISGSAPYHLFSAYGGFIEYIVSTTVTVTGTPAFTFFAYATNGGAMSAQNGVVTFSGSATGQRYAVAGNATLDTAGGGANFFPGSTAGAIATGGQYF